MSTTNSTWDKLKAKKTEAQPAKKTTKISSMSDEMKEEIMQMREKKKAFDATNEGGYYCVVLFSCDADRIQFVKNIKMGLSRDTVFLDGYVVAQKLNVEPKMPSMKLPAPLDATRFKND